jgi:2'-5' RNA ligase
VNILGDDAMLTRAFVAVVPPEEILNAMEKFLSSLRPLADYKWVSRPQLHVTLRFLGEITSTELDDIKTKLENVKTASFDLSFDHSGAFPGFTRAKVLWISGKKGSAELKQLAAQAEQIVVSCGLAPEKRNFSPHLTIARTKIEGNIPEELIQAMKDTPVLSWQCSDFILMQSQLTPHGPIYTPIKRYRLTEV